MNKLIRKLISILFLLVFLFVSGPGQLIHLVFHDHSFTTHSNKRTAAINTPHSYCNALQPALTEFFESGIYNLKNISVLEDHFFADLKQFIPDLIFFKTSDRAPPVLA